MPPLAKNVVDTSAMTVIAAWIASLTPTASTLPIPWADNDLGLPLPGGADWANSQFNVRASGDDIWNAADAGHFVWQRISGDGKICARVVSVQATGPWAKAGVMFRESLAANSKNVFLGITPGNGTFLQWRTNTAGQCNYVPGPGVFPSYQFRLDRAGDIFTGYASPDGTNWTFVGSVSNRMDTNAFFGLAGSAFNVAAIGQSVFDNVSLVFSNGQPIYVTTSAAAGTATITQQTVQFGAQAYAGHLSTNTVDITENHAGTVTVQGDNAPSGEVGANAFDNSIFTKWLDFANANPSTRASWIQYACPGGAQAAVTQYTVTSANDAPERDPQNWRLLGSNNGGTNWTTLDMRTNVVFTNRYETHAYAFANTTAFNTYRFQIDSVANPASANSVQLSELEFISQPVSAYTYAWNFGDGTSAATQNPTHTYTNNGSYTVTVIAGDGTGFATNTFAVTIALGAPATAQWITNSAGVVQKKFHVRFAGTDGASYIVEASTNLKSWTPVLTNVPTGGFLNFTDNASTNLPFRFYRIRTP